ncbi:FAD/NAD(P)-binding domain-containing protein [Flammula alnicola]|nr:FAD/NAD(P)-binding domain-containing protein [Flammula alnicola]
MNTVPKLRLAIVGGGIGGLTLAVAISRLNIDKFIQVDIYEAAAKLTQVGAGISLWPRGWEILKDLGLDDDLAPHIILVRRFRRKIVHQVRLSFVITVRKSDHKEDVYITDLIFPGGMLSFHRADVQDVLLKHISSSVQTHLDRRLTGYQESDNGIKLFFKNGETATCDLLVGADGINSAVRREFLAKENNLHGAEAITNARPVWTGTVIYRSMIDSEVIKRQAPNHPSLATPMVYCGKSKHVISYPISRGKLINIGAFVSEPEKEGSLLDGPAVTNSTTDDIASHFVNWSEEVQCVIMNMDNPSRWAIETVKPLDKYALGRSLVKVSRPDIVKAHAMPPHLGNGAGQAIEDAYVLANVLAKAVQQGHVDISKITGIYSAIRQPFGNFAANTSRNQGLRYEFGSPGFEDVKEGDTLSPERLSALGESVGEGWKWTWNSSIAEDLRRPFRWCNGLKYYCPESPKN